MMTTLSQDPLYFFDESASGRLARAIDWSRHDLGPAGDWPAPLKTSLGVLFRHHQPMLLFWGAEHFCFYNDALVNSLNADKRPRAIGVPGALCAPEIWHSMKSQISGVLNDGRPSHNVRHLVPHLQKGKIEGIDWTHSYTPVFDADGRSAGVLVTCTQSARTVFSVHALKASEEQLKLALASGRMGTWTISLANNKFALSDEAYMIFGLGKECDTTDSAINELIHPDDRERVSQALSRAIRSGESYSDKYRILRPDGEVRWLNSRGQAVYDSENKPFLLAGIVMDISETKAVEQKLDERTRLLETILEQMPMAVVVAEAPTGRLLFANKRLDEVWRHSFKLAAGIGNDSQHFGFHKDGRPYEGDDWPLARAILKGEITVGEEIDAILGDGSRGIIRVSAAPVRDREGRIVAGVGLAENVTERKVNEQKLTETLAILEAIMETSTDAIYIKDRQSRMIYGNPATFRHIGRPAEEVLGKNDIESLGPGRGGEEIVEIDRQIMQSGQRQIIEELVGPEGDQRVFQSNKAPYRDSDGNIIGLVGISRNITEQRHATEALRRSEATLRTILDRLPVGVVVASPAGDIIQFNQKILDIWGECGTIGMERYKEFEGYRIDSGKRIAIHEWALARALLKKEIVLNEVIRIRAFDGKDKIILNSALPIQTESGQPTGAIAVIQDITDQKRLEQELRSAKDAAEAANEMKSAFLANMSHEIRTPLGAILGFADLLRETHLDSEERENYHEIIKRNGEQLSSLINDILDLSKIEAGQLKTEILRAPIRSAIEEVCSLLSVKAHAKGLELHWTIDDAVPELIGTDPLRLRQILTNVIGNAIKFTKRGSIDVHASPGTKSTLCLTVSDTGIGIAHEQRANLFKPFSQADTSITRRYGGTGLGLTLSRRLANALGGDLILKSSCLGVGSAFELTLDDQFTASANSRSSLHSAHAGNGSRAGEREKLKGLRLLLVEDATDNQMLITQIMKRHGANVELASNGREGVEKAMAGDHDLILMDIQMPVMDGYTATQTLREQGFQRPIVALTAHAMNEVRKKCLNVGCNDQLTKPIRRDELIHVVAQYAERGI